MRTLRSRLAGLSALVLTLAALAAGGCPLTGGGGGTEPFNRPPTVVLTADVVRGIAPLTVRFDSSGSSDDSLIVARQWNFDDEETSQDIAPTHTFIETGNFGVTLTLTDDDGASATRTITISVTEAPVPVIVVDRTTADFAPATFSFDASESYDPDGSIRSYQWDFDDGSREVVPAVTHVFATAGTYRVRLTVTDNVGVTASADQMIQVGITEPEIEFRTPPASIRNIVLSPECPLWVAVVFDVEPGIPRTTTAGLDRDSDPCDAQAVLYEALSGQVLQRLLGPGDRVRAVAFSPDGTLALVTGEDATLWLFDVSTGDLAHAPIVDDAPAILGVAFSPDGTRFVHGGSDGSVVLRSTETGSIVRTFAGHPGFAVNDVAYSPDGQHVASASDDATVIVWDVDTGDATVLDAAAGGHDEPVNAIAFSSTHADLLASGSDDQSARLWRLSTQSVIQTLGPKFEGAVQVSGHTDAVTSLAFSPDGLVLATGSADNTAKLWNISSGSSSEAETFSGHSSDVMTVVFAPGATQVLTGSADGTARIWDIDTAETARTLTPCESTISSADYSPDGLSILLGVAARNQIQLDTIPPGGNDLNLTVPAQLDLSVLGEDEYPAQYRLWTELDTDRSDPVRTYAAATINVVAPYTESVTAETPRVPLIGDQAFIVSAPTPDRQVYDLGPLQAGDRLSLSLASVPGYGQFYDSDVFSLLVLDAQGQMFVWYQDGTPFSPDDSLIIGHDSPSYYAVVDGCRRSVCDRDYFAASVTVQIEREVGLTPRQQRIYLDFDGGDNLVIGDVGPIDVPEFDAADLNPGWGADETSIIRIQVRERLQDLFEGYNVVVSSDASSLAPPYVTVYFGGTSGFYGSESFPDPRNQTLSGSALVSTDEIASAYPTFSASEMGTAFGNVAAHYCGYVLGLREGAGGFTDVMDNSFMSSSTYIRSTSPQFTISPLSDDHEYNGQIGTQNAPQLLQEIVGTN